MPADKWIESSVKGGEDTIPKVVEVEKKQIVGMDMVQEYAENHHHIDEKHYVILEPVEDGFIQHIFKGNIVVQGNLLTSNKFLTVRNKRGVKMA